MQQMFTTEKGLTPILVLLLLAIGLGVAVLAVKHPTAFKPRADTDNTNPVMADQPAAQPNTLTNGLISYWNFDEISGDNVADLTGANPGKVTGTTIVSGKFGMARNFDTDPDRPTKNGAPVSAKATSWVDLGSSATMAPTTGLSVSAWINPNFSKDSNDGSGPSIITNFGVWSLSLQYDRYWLSAPQVWFSIYGAGGSFGCVSQSKLPVNQWSHVVASTDFKTATIFINGKQSDSCGAAISPATANPNSNTIGISKPRGYSFSFTGIIDEVGVWGRILSTAEIQALAAGQVPGAGTKKDDTLTASANPCILQGETCSTTLSWSSSKPNIVLKAKVGNSAELDFAAGPTGSKQAPWITSQGVTFNLYSGTTLLKSLYVGGTLPNTILAAPNPCVLKADGTCSTTISWEVSADKTNPSVTAQVAGTGPEIFFDGSFKSKEAPWITGQGVTFRLYSGTTLLDTKTVAGVAASKITAFPPTCRVSAQGVCTTTVFWNAEGKTDVKVKAVVGNVVNSGDSGGGNTEILFVNGPVGTQNAPWITTTGVTFRLYSGTTLLDSVFVKGN